MLNVDYKTVIGQYTLTQGNKKFKITLCGANCLWAEMYFYTGGKGEKMVHLHSFINDLAHMKRCIKSGIMYNDANNFVFNAEHLDSEMWKAIQLIVGLGKKVTIK